MSSPLPRAARDASPRNFEHPVAFWVGVAASTIGVVLHLPMYWSARSMHFRMAGMQPDLAMVIGMGLIIFGLAASLYGLWPRNSQSIRQKSVTLRVRALDDAPIRRQHVAMLLVMGIAVVIDAMKPISLGFVAPGMAQEYGLKSPLNPHGGLPVSLLPLAGITGTVIGSLVWGALGDRIGRRASILYASIMFMTTAICGAMPSFEWNLLMCWLMGLAAGGMLPITFALLAETIPARYRSWLMVMVGGEAALAYVITSWAAGALTPTYSWRILWLIGLPTGLLIPLLNHWIPESPRFLLAAGRTAAAERVMVRYGAEAVTVTAQELAEPGTEAASGYRQLFGRPFTGVTAAITVLAVGIGLVTYGFQLWIPTNLQHLGFTAAASDYIIRNAALIGLPLTVIAALLYGFWGSKRTIILLTALTGVSLLGFAVAGNGIAHDQTLLSALLIIPVAGMGTVAAVVTSYSSEIYPTHIRSRGAGLNAGMAKAGGVLVIALVVAAATVPSIAQTALIGAVPLVVATVVFALVGAATDRRGLEEIQEAAMASASAPALRR